MNKKERPFCLIKFGKKEYLELLRENGELYFNTTMNLNKAKKANVEQGDENEGAEWIENIKLAEIKCTHPTLGEFKFKTISNKPSELTQFYHNFLTCSFYIITTKDFENTNIFQIDEKMLQFGEYALVIKNPKIFLDDLVQALEIEDRDYTARKVEYTDLTTEGRIELNPFTKKIEHLHQKEYRIVLHNQIEPKVLRLKKLKENSEIYLSEYIVQSKWEAIRE